MAASLAIDAVTSADTTPSIASRSAASAPNQGSRTRAASMNPAQNRTGSASAASHDSQNVSPAGRAAAQADSNTLLPAPADPATRVSRWPAPAVSRSCRADLVTSVLGSGTGRNFATANRAPSEVLRSIVAACAAGRPPGSFPAPTKAPSAATRIMPTPNPSVVRTPFHLALGLASSVEKYENRALAHEWFGVAGGHPAGDS